MKMKLDKTGGIELLDELTELIEASKKKVIT